MGDVQTDEVGGCHRMAMAKYRRGVSREVRTIDRQVGIIEGRLQLDQTR